MFDLKIVAYYDDVIAVNNIIHSGRGSGEHVKAYILQRDMIMI